MYYTRKTVQSFSSMGPLHCVMLIGILLTVLSQVGAIQNDCELLRDMEGYPLSKICAGGTSLGRSVLVDMYDTNNLGLSTCRCKALVQSPSGTTSLSISNFKDLGPNMGCGSYVEVQRTDGEKVIRECRYGAASMAVEDGDVITVTLFRKPQSDSRYCLSLTLESLSSSTNLTCSNDIETTSTVTTTQSTSSTTSQTLKLSTTSIPTTPHDSTSKLTHLPSSQQPTTNQLTTKQPTTTQTTTKQITTTQTTTKQPTTTQSTTKQQTTTQSTTKQPITTPTTTKHPTTTRSTTKQPTTTQSTTKQPTTTQSTTKQPTTTQTTTKHQTTTQSTTKQPTTTQTTTKQPTTTQSTAKQPTTQSTAKRPTTTRSTTKQPTTTQITSMQTTSPTTAKELTQSFTSPYTIIASSSTTSSTPMTTPGTSVEGETNTSQDSLNIIIPTVVGGFFLFVVFLAIRVYCCSAKRTYMGFGSYSNPEYSQFTSRKSHFDRSIHDRRDEDMKEIITDDYSAFHSSPPPCQPLPAGSPVHPITHQHNTCDNPLFDDTTDSEIGSSVGSTSSVVAVSGSSSTCKAGITDVAPDAPLYAVVNKGPRKDNMTFIQM